MEPRDQRGADFIVGQGEMAERIRRKDWSATPLGPLEAWPQSLRTAVSLCLASDVAVNVIWGPQHSQVYNDGYRAVCGELHPGALGEAYDVTWAGAWPAGGEPFARALAGEASVVERQRMLLARNGRLEASSFTFSLTPIRAEDGGIGGLFLVATETAASGLPDPVRALEDQLRTRDDGGAQAQLPQSMESAGHGRIQSAPPESRKLEAVGRLTGGVAHEFNNLMMVVAGAISVLEQQPDARRQRQAIEGMRRAVERGSALTRQLLAFAGAKPLPPQPVDLAACVAGMGLLLDRTLGGQVRVACQCAPDLWPARVDAGELEMALLNLGVHARDAMPKGGTVVIAADNVTDPPGLPAGDYVRLSVQDTGQAMAPPARERASGFGQDPGPGLAQVEGFCRRSGGTAQVDSAPGRGTTVTLLLPRSPLAPPSAPPAPGAAAPKPLATRTAKRVLLVEDDGEVAELVAEMLEHLGYRLVRATTAAEALFLMEHDDEIDLVFSDVMMPGKLTGVDLARRVRLSHPELPVILTSGYAESFRQAAHAEGVLLLPKPYAMDELRLMIERALQARVH